MITLLSLFSSVLFGILCSQYAAERGRQPRIWFYIGFLSGLIGLIALFLLPKLKVAEPAASKEIEVPPEPETPDPRFQNWFYVDKSRTTQGPVPFRRLFIAWRDQLISQDSLVWTEGMPHWEPIHKVPNLLEKLN